MLYGISGATGGLNRAFHALRKSLCDYQELLCMNTIFMETKEPFACVEDIRGTAIYNSRCTIAGVYGPIPTLEPFSPPKFRPLWLAERPMKVKLDDTARFSVTRLLPQRVGLH